MGNGTAVQQMNSGGTVVNIASYNGAMIRQKVALQAAVRATLKMSAKTVIMQTDGNTIFDTGELPGIEHTEKLNHEVMIQVDHSKVPKLWQS